MLFFNPACKSFLFFLLLKGLFLKKVYENIHFSNFSSIFPLNFLIELVIGWEYKLEFKSSQSQALSKNLEEKLMKNRRSVLSTPY